MVVPDETCANLIGSQAVQQMGFLDIHFEQLHNRSAAPKTCRRNIREAQWALSEQGLLISDILSKYPDVFEGLGELWLELQLEVEDYATHPVVSPEDPRSIDTTAQAALRQTTGGWN